MLNNNLEQVPCPEYQSISILLFDIFGASAGYTTIMGENPGINRSRGGQIPRYQQFFSTPNTGSKKNLELCKDCQKGKYFFYKNMQDVIDSMRFSRFDVTIEFGVDFPDFCIFGVRSRLRSARWTSPIAIPYEVMPANVLEILFPTFIAGFCVPQSHNISGIRVGRVYQIHFARQGREALFTSQTAAYL